MRRPDSYEYFDDYLRRVETEKYEDDDFFIALAALGGMVGTGGIGFAAGKEKKEDE